MSQNDTEMQKFILGGTILAMIVMALVVAGIFMAMAAVAGFVFYQWRDIYRYEGSKPVLWLLVITAILAVPCLIAAYDQFQVGNFLLKRKDDRWIGAMLLAVAYVLGLAVPTAFYWLYRKIKPVSHIRVAYIEHWHEAYRKGEITRIERGANIRETIAKGDVALEEIHARSLQRQQRPTPQSGSAFDVPGQD